mgnify:FL=1
MEHIVTSKETINIQDILEISKEAGKNILEFYHKDYEIVQKKTDTQKSGFSPVTEADVASNKLITEFLNKKYPLIPILSEEGKEISYEERKKWSLFWLVDPLDGTKNFINKDGEFTVNIALVNE